jgi:hypothetical protein
LPGAGLAAADEVAELLVAFDVDDEDGVLDEPQAARDSAASPARVATAQRRAEVVVGIDIASTVDP